MCLRCDDQKNCARKNRECHATKIGEEKFSATGKMTAQMARARVTRMRLRGMAGCGKFAAMFSNRVLYLELEGGKNAHRS